VQEFFSHEQEEDTKETEKEEKEEKEVKAEKMEALEAEEEMTYAEPEPMYFEEDAKNMEAVAETVEGNTTDVIVEDDMTEDIQEIPQAQNQGDYFTREAGIENEEEEPKNDGGLSDGFYEDK
jgi:hypothetical protein